jgi:hypothetical protein
VISFDTALEQFALQQYSEDAQVASGSGAPTALLAPGQLYLDLVSGDLYKMNAGGTAWALQFNIKSTGGDVPVYERVSSGIYSQFNAGISNYTGAVETLLSLNRVYTCIFNNKKAVSISELGIGRTTGAAVNVTMAIYSLDGSYYPTDRLAYTLGFATTSGALTMQPIVGGPILIPKGYHAISILSQSAIPVNGLPVVPETDPLGITQISGSQYALNLRSMLLAYSAAGLPSTHPAGLLPIAMDATPNLLYRVA